MSIVTGGSSGIGRSLAVALARQGDHVIIVGRDRTRLESTLEALRREGDGRHCAWPIDVSNPAETGEMVSGCRREYGRVDALVASAGIGRSDPTQLPKPTADLSLAEWQAVIGVNLHGVFLSNTAVLPFMKERGEGVIVNICSSTTPHGLRGRALAPAYCAAKFAVAEFSRTLASEVAPFGIRVHSIFPGSVETPLIARTALNAPFGGSMSQESFAAAVLGLVALGREAEIPDPHVLPLPGRGGESSSAPVAN